MVTARPAELLAGGPLSFELDGPDGRVRVSGGRPGAGVLLVEVTARTLGTGGTHERVARRRHLLDVTGA